jgi:ferredoxin
MRVEVDQSSCMGSGQCVLWAPTVFDQDNDGLVTVLDGVTTWRDAGCSAAAVGRMS